MIAKSITTPVTNALDRGHTFAEIAKIFDLQIQDVEAFSAAMNEKREATAIGVLRAGGDLSEAMEKSSLGWHAVKALKNRLLAEEDAAPQSKGEP